MKLPGEKGDLRIVTRFIRIADGAERTFVETYNKSFDAATRRNAAAMAMRNVGLERDGMLCLACDYEYLK